jgi:hypothetical protein
MLDRIEDEKGPRMADVALASLRRVFTWRAGSNVRVSNFPQPAVLRLLPTRETLPQQYARWRRRIPLRDGAQGDRAVWQPGAYIRSCELGSVVERAHSNVARKAKGVANTKSVMPRKLARHNRSSGGARSHPNVRQKLCDATNWRWREGQSAPGPSVLPPLAGFPKKSRPHLFPARSFVPDSHIGRLFDHLVGEGEEHGRNFNAELFRSLEIDNQLKLRGLNDRQLGRLGAFTDQPGAARGQLTGLPRVYDEAAN